MAEKMNWGDGEELSFTDLNDSQSLILKQLLEDVGRGLWLEGLSATGAIPILRTVGRGAEVIPTSGGGDIKATPQSGLVFFDNGGSDPVEQNVLCAYLSSPAELTFDPSHPTLYRRDIVSVALTEVVGSSATRDFKDAVTLAPSTQTFDKRRTVTADFVITKGTDQATAQLADDNEPATPSGYAKVWSGRIDPAATSFSASSARDYRTPAGIGRVFVGPEGAWFDEVSGEWPMEDNARDESSTAAIYFPFPRTVGRPVLYGADLQPGHAQCRIRAIRLAYAFATPGTPPVVELVQTWRGNTSSISESIVLDVSGDVTADGTFQVSALSLPDDPLWGNGLPGPNSSNLLLTQTPDLLAVKIQGTGGGGGNEVYGVDFEFYGG